MNATATTSAHASTALFTTEKLRLYEREIQQRLQSKKMREREYAKLYCQNGIAYFFSNSSGVTWKMVTMLPITSLSPQRKVHLPRVYHHISHGFLRMS